MVLPKGKENSIMVNLTICLLAIKLPLIENLTLYFIMLKNGPTDFKNLPV